MRSLKRVAIFVAITITLSVILVLAGITITYLSLNNSSWQLDYLVLNNERQTTYTHQTPSLHFEGLEIRGSGGCNDLFGRYIPLMFGRLTISSLGRTAVGCRIVNEETGERIDVNYYEAQFLDALWKAHRVELEAQTLRVYFGKGEADVIVFVRLP